MCVCVRVSVCVFVCGRVCTHTHTHIIRAGMYYKSDAPLICTL